MSSQKKAYQLLIFQDQSLIYYYSPLSMIPANYQSLQQQHRIQNTLGVCNSLSALIKQIHPNPSTQIRNFKTKQYQFNMYDTINGFKIVLITAVRQDQKADQVIKAVYQAYISYVKRNYLVQRRHDQKIDVKHFDQQVKKLIKTLIQK